ncbi:methionyl-tRNA formyltransferase [Polaribacter dokdonensis]|uniref:Methionyl-tRNA formyltransferase n=1 Tax=Polaribacter dokdonensis DSW-5 TaxID=1300348 RepID=A0A0M9CGN0_9FLAO|nr:methionyl-tRNA formyltransferase [Polaribacter dokdonensis]KOY52251.1 Methionyl-tRNA formyltransferase [Polaribacter dokdonensis DSW-5]SEE41946.1 methionyl-tRNA formyltransferase [Polaribacter dokdonensis DSW-5]
MKDLRIVFMGTPDFAVTILRHLVEHNYNIVGVITAADKPAGRGRKLNESAVKKYAVSQNLTVLQPTNLKSESFLEELKLLNADLQVVVAFRMLPKAVWQMPKLGTFNLHASLLPEYRGAAPIHWAIINGEEKTGVTTFFIDEKIDTGEIILQSSIIIKDDETVGSLHDRLMYLGANLVSETVDKIEEGEIKTKKQPDLEEKQAPKLFAENTQIDWSQPLSIIYNKIRGLNPFPAAWTIIQNNEEQLKAKIYEVEKVKEDHNYKIGKLITSKSELKVAVTDGFIIIDQIKIAGKKKLDSKSLLNGFQFSENAKML